MMFEQLTIGGWLSANSCPVRSLVDQEEQHVTLIFGTTGYDFELSLDVETLREVLELGARALDMLCPANGSGQ
jgi:hypothetical protein